MHKLLNIKIGLTFLIIFNCIILKAQESQIKQAFDFPTKEIYDLHVDKHGFLWIASDFGVSRYDGINCIHFSNPHQISLGCTNLLEDNFGRIWFNNFNGQIFYIDHETMTLVESYDYKRESNYPRMVLFHDQLLATSDKGLFVVDTKTLNGKYISNGTYTSSMTVLKNNILVHGINTWYTYNGVPRLKKLAYLGDNEIRSNVYTLAKSSYRDTAYLMVNPSGAVRKLFVNNDTVRQCTQTTFNSFINTISISDDNQWINTNNCSYSLKTGEKIAGYNLSDIKTDLEGNRWLSSLYYGLLIQYKKDVANKTEIPSVDEDDLVVSVKNYRGKLLLGTQKGFLILYDPVSKVTSFKIRISTTTGSINNLASIGGDEFMVASSIATFKINVLTQKVIEYADIKTVKQLCYDDKAVYIASTSGLFVLPRQKSSALNAQINNAFGHALKYSPADDYFYLRVRSRAIAYFPDQMALYLSIKNSLFKIDSDGIKPFKINNDQVYAASLAYMDHCLYIGTISNGMLIIQKNGINHISVQNGLFSKSIFKLKAIDKNLWILGSGPLQIFSTTSRALVNNYEFPDRNASQVLDLDGSGHTIYLATSSGLDSFPLVKTRDNKKLKNYLLYVKVNNQIATGNDGYKLSYSQNNVMFSIGVPAYLKAKDIYLKYSLVTKTDSTWLTTEPGERTIRFSSLMHGKYTLKAIAVDPRLGMADAMIKYNFIIAEPWWNGTIFKVFLVILFLLMMFYGYVIMLRKRLSLKRAFDTQQQLISAERQRISSEMHDDIGSGVFAIQSLADKASKTGIAGPEVDQIKNLVNELSAKIRDVIWSTNVGNDTLEMLLYYIYVQIEKLFEHSTIKLVPELPDIIPELKITVQSRRTVYLLVKEIVHNAIKHSKASVVELKMSVNEQSLMISINDNGVGLNPENSPSKGTGTGMGLGNIRSRIEKLNGQFKIQSNNGVQIEIKIPFSELKVTEFDRQLNNWQLFITKIFKIPSDVKSDQ